MGGLVEEAVIGGRNGAGAEERAGEEAREVRVAVGEGAGDQRVREEEVSAGEPGEAGVEGGWIPARNRVVWTM